MNEQVKVEFNIKLPLYFKERSKWIVACCPPLDLFSQGETIEKARDNIVEALTAFLLSCFERGVLEQVLKECGFSPCYEGMEQSSIPVKKSEKHRIPVEYVDVPLPLLFSQDYHNRCHA
jgi:predicted RNase H-like HicB family nuclease